MNTDVPEARACECPARIGNTHILARPHPQLAAPRRREGIRRAGRGGAVGGWGARQVFTTRVAEAWKLNLVFAGCTRLFIM